MQDAEPTIERGTDMSVIVRQSDQPSERRRPFWAWCFASGFSPVEIADPVLVDLDRGIVTINQLVPVSQPGGDPDFPELQRDDSDRPLTEVRTVPLVAPLPAGLVTQADQSLAA